LPYFDWPSSADRFLRFDTVRSTDANGALDQVTTGFEAVEADVARAIKIPGSPTPSDQLINMNAATRASTVVAFDSSGNVTAIAAGFRWRGDWVTATAYIINDVYRNPANGDLYVTLLAHTSGASIAADLAALKVQLAVNVAAVTASAAAAAASEAAAAASAAAAAASAVTASGHATTATTQATNSAASAVASAASAASAAASYDSFDDRYLGAKASDPTLDNDGNALITGAIYWNSTSSVMKAWTGAAWDTVFIPASGYALLSGAAFTGAVSVATTFGVTGATTLSSTLGVTGAATFGSTIATAGNITAGSTATAANTIISATVAGTHTAIIEAHTSGEELIQMVANGAALAYNGIPASQAGFFTANGNINFAPNGQLIGILSTSGLDITGTITAAATGGYYLGGNLFSLFSGNKTNIYSGSSGMTLWDVTGANARLAIDSAGAATFGSTINAAGQIRTDLAAAGNALILNGGGSNFHISVGNAGNNYIWNTAGGTIFRDSSNTVDVLTIGTAGAAVTGTLSATGNASVGTLGNGVFTIGDTASYGVVSGAGGAASIYLNGSARGGSGGTASGAIVAATDDTFYFYNAAVNTLRASISSAGLATAGNIAAGSTSTAANTVVSVTTAGTHVAIFQAHSSGDEIIEMVANGGASAYTGIPASQAGFYSVTAPINFAPGGVLAAVVSTAGLAVTGTFSTSGAATLSSTLAVTGAITTGGSTVGTREILQNSQSAAYTLVLADSGKHILHPSADTTARIWTIPANSSVAFPIGTAVTFINQNSAGVITIAITTDTMRWAGSGTTGSRTLAANGIATAVKVTSTEWIISGTGLT
jgi:hypothetical protein